MFVLLLLIFTVALFRCDNFLPKERCPIQSQKPKTVFVGHTIYTCSRRCTVSTVYIKQRVNIDSNLFDQVLETELN